MFPFGGMVDVVLQDAWVYCIEKDEGDESVPFLDLRRDDVSVIFLKYSKEGRLSANSVGIRIFQWDVCYDDTKHYQMSSGKHNRF